MTSQTSVSLLKSHLNLDHNLDDDLLVHKLTAAETWVSNYIGNAFDKDNAAQTEAVLQLAAYWYEQREAASFGAELRPVPFGVRDLLETYKEQVTGHVA